MVTQRRNVAGPPENRADVVEAPSTAGLSRHTAGAGQAADGDTLVSTDAPLQSQRPVPPRPGRSCFPLKEVTVCSKDNRKTISMP